MALVAGVFILVAGISFSIWALQDSGSESVATEDSVAPATEARDTLPGSDSPNSQSNGTSTGGVPQVATGTSDDPSSVGASSLSQPAAEPKPPPSGGGTAENAALEEHETFIVRDASGNIKQTK